MAQTDPAVPQRRIIFDCVDTNLFLLIPNNSGSTFLSKAIAACRGVASLPHEGQYVPGFRGPTPIAHRVGAVWTEKESVFTDSARYDWRVTKKVWAFHARSTGGETPRLFVEKSPPNVVRAVLLKQHFPRCRFVLMVRNPYAMAEGVMRQNPTVDAATAARHVLRCLEWQARNHRRWPEAPLLTYETLCAEPLAGAARLREAFPALEDLDLGRSVSVKRRYHEGLRDMNEQQIARLGSATITSMNRMFAGAEDLLAQFGYQLIASGQDWITGE